MITLLTLAVLGQQCRIVNDQQVCTPASVSPIYPQAAQVRTSVRIGDETAWRRYIVRIETDLPPKFDGNTQRWNPVTGWGSGIILQSDGARAIVLTNKHVLEEARSVSVHHQSGRYGANILQIAAEDDLAALEIRSPVTPMCVPIATDGGGKVTMLGFDGPTGAYHVHRVIRQTGYPSQVYGFVTHQGESGSPILNDRGQLVSLAWGSDGQSCSVAVTFPAIRAFLQGLGRFLRPRPGVVVLTQARSDPVVRSRVDSVLASPGYDPSLVPPLIPAPPMPFAQLPAQLPTLPKQLPAAIIPSPQNPIAVAPTPDFPALMITNMKNGHPQQFVNGKFATRIIRPTMTIDPHTNQPIFAYDINLESDLLIGQGTPSQ